MKQRNGNGTNGPPEPVLPSINQKYQALGGSNGFLGMALSQESTTTDGVGRCRQYQGGSIYWFPTTGAFEVHGAIRDKWMSLGAETSFLGYPISDERGTPDGIGRFNDFTNGSIYWTPSTGAHEVHGPIQEKWGQLGWEVGYGYPTSDEMIDVDGVTHFNNFEAGTIHWSPTLGAYPCAEEGKQYVFLNAQPLLPGGCLPYVGSFPTFAIYNGHLKDITNVSVPILSFVKAGHSSAECEDPNAVIRLANRMTTSSNDITAIFGTPTPPLPVTLGATISGVATGPESVEILITYTFTRRS